MSHYDKVYEKRETEDLIYTGFNEAMNLAYANAKNSGWHNDPLTGELLEVDFPRAIALMHSELSEALEAHRKDLMDDKLLHRKGIEVELTDCLIRIFDTAAALDLDLGQTFIEKCKYNSEVALKTNKDRLEPHGKKY